MSFQIRQAGRPVGRSVRTTICQRDSRRALVIKAFIRLVEQKKDHNSHTQGAEEKRGKPTSPRVSSARHLIWFRVKAWSLLNSTLQLTNRREKVTCRAGPGSRQEMCVFELSWGLLKWISEIRLTYFLFFFYDLLHSPRSVHHHLLVISSQPPPSPLPLAPPYCLVHLTDRQTFKSKGTIFWPIRDKNTYLSRIANVSYQID